MRNILFALITFLAITSCEFIDNAVFTDTYFLRNKGLYGIDVGGEIELVLSTDMYDDEIEITANNYVLRNLEVVDRNNLLSIRLNDNVRDGGTIKVKASAYTFNEIYASGMAYVDADNRYDYNNAEEPYFREYYIGLSGSAEYRGRANGDVVIIEQSGNTRCNITYGIEAPEVHLAMSGSSVLKTNQFTPKYAYINMSGSTRAEMAVSQFIKGVMNGSSYFRCTTPVRYSEVRLTGSARIDYADQLYDDRR